MQDFLCSELCNTEGTKGLQKSPCNANAPESLLTAQLRRVKLIGLLQREWYLIVLLLQLQVIVLKVVSSRFWTNVFTVVSDTTFQCNILAIIYLKPFLY